MVCRSGTCLDRCLSQSAAFAASAHGQVQRQRAGFGQYGICLLVNIGLKVTISFFASVPPSRMLTFHSLSHRLGHCSACS